MDVFDLFAKLSLDTSEYEEKLGQAASDGRSFLQGAGGMLGTAAKATGAALAASATAVAGLAAQAVDAYADYEQLVGGVEVLFGDTADQVMENAANAFSTAGLSANEYMETVTGFAASLTNSLGENAWQAAAYADEAITDMADNANRMGTSMESIQNAYAGFAKGNFTMLDNLKLGYGGTKEEMERLMRDAEQLEGYMEGSLDMNNFADVVEAIHIVQENMGIAGATAEEAGSTISGSMAMAKSAWENLIAGFANPDSNLGELIDNFIQSGLTALNNLMPTIINALSGIAQALPQIVGAIVDLLPTILPEIIPPLIESAIMIVNALVEALPTILQALIDALPMIMELMVNTMITLLPMLVDLGLQLILALADGLIQSLPTLIPAIVDVILTIVDKLTDPDTLVMLVEAALQLMIALAEGLINALPKIIEKAPEIVKNLVEAIIRIAPELLKAALELILTLAAGIVDSLDKLIEKGAEIVDAVKEGFMEKVEAAKTWGKDMIENFISGIKEKWEKLKSTVTDLASTIKSLLGFSEPEVGPLSNFHTYAPDMMDLFAQGIKDNEKMLYNTVADAFDFQGMIMSKTPVPALASAGMGSGFNENDIVTLISNALQGIAVSVTIGDEKLDNIISTSIQRTNYRSGGR